MTTEHSNAITPRAWLVLPGHRDVPAEVRVVRYPFWSRIWRTGALAWVWGSISIAVFFLTIFDPFLSSIPAIIGSASVWRSYRGHFRVESFAGRCPRCETPVRLERGTRIATPHKLVCYYCHHEPQLAILP